MGTTQLETREIEDTYYEDLEGKGRGREEGYP